MRLEEPPDVRPTGHLQIKGGPKGRVWYALWRDADVVTRSALARRTSGTRDGAQRAARSSGGSERLEALGRPPRRYLSTEFGVDTLLHTIETKRVDAFRERMLADGHLSRRTIQKILVLLHGILKRAKRRGWIASNPAEDAERVAVRRRGDFNGLAPEEVQAVARADGSELYAAIYVTAAFTGLRMGELRALPWSDVDFAKRLVDVRRSLTGNAYGAPSRRASGACPERSGRPRARQFEPSRRGRARRRPRVFTGLQRADSSRHGSQALLPCARGRGPGPPSNERRPDRLPRSSAHVRHAGRSGVPAVRRQGDDGPRGHHNDDDLCTSRATG